ncbi:MAG: hypothetical protein AB1444_15180 [Spirochaetota bacterium]
MSFKMKVLLAGFMFMFIHALSLFANELFQEDGIFPNHSAEYVRTLNRNASTEADATFYNPAGLTYLPKGLYVMFSNQTLHKKRTHVMDYYAIEADFTLNIGNIDNPVQPTTNSSAYTNRPTGSLESDNNYFTDITAPAMPDLNVVYRDQFKGHEYAIFFNLGVMQAAPDVTFPRGLAIIDYGNLAVGEVSAKLVAFPGTALETSQGPVTQYTYESNIAVRTEYFIGNTIGVSYKIIDMLSASLGFRFIYGMGRQTINVKNATILHENQTDPLNLLPEENLFINNSDWNIDTQYSGFGYGIITGLHCQPIQKLDIGLRYEYYFPMILTKKTNKFQVPAIIEETGMLNIFKDGKANPDFNGGAGYSAGNGEKEFKGTYPQSISLGMAYSIFKWLKVMSSGDIYLRHQVDLDGREKDFGIAYRAGGALEFLPNADIKLSTGYSYYNPGIKNEKRNEIDPLLISHTIGAGAGLKVNEGLEVTIGAFYTIYQSTTVYEVIHTTSVLNNVLGIINGTAEATHYVKKELAE